MAEPQSLVKGCSISDTTFNVLTHSENNVDLTSRKAFDCYIYLLGFTCGIYSDVVTQFLISDFGSFADTIQ